MKLCADILYWKLKEELKAVSLHGDGSQELRLLRPEFYLDQTKTFEKDHVYVCSADHLPMRPSLGENVCLVCLGQHWNLNVFYDRCSVITIEADTDIFRVFNLVQQIYDRYEAWEEQLRYILSHGASLAEMLSASSEIFSNPMQLIGFDFRYLAVTDEEYFRNELGIRLDTEIFDAEKMATFLTMHDLSTHVREPLLLELMGHKTLSVNLLDQDEYLGCLTIFERFRPLRNSDSALSVFLAKLLKQAILQNPILAGTRSAIRRALKSVVAGQPVDFELRRALSQENGKNDWVCVRLQPRSGMSALPGSYLSASIEERHPGSMAFEYECSVAAFMPSDGDIRETTLEFSPILEKFGLVCGISSSFSSLYDANQAWFQASSALQNGLLKNAGDSIFFFQDYLLPQLLSGAMSGRPARVYYTDGLKRLKAHDETSQVSYLETLRLYLDNNLSVTKTAAALFLHRSTLLDRLSHITQLLGGDLKDPDFCLTLSILLRVDQEQ